MLALACVLSVASLASAQRPALVNEFVDKQMEALNANLTRTGQESRNISAGSVNGVEFSKGVQWGVNTLKRTGDSRAAYIPEDLAISHKYQVGYDELTFRFDRVTYKGFERSGVFKVPENVIQLHFTVHYNTSCKVTLEEFKYTKFDSVIFKFSDKSDVRFVAINSELKDALLSHANSNMELQKPWMEGRLQAICAEGFPKVFVNVAGNLVLYLSLRNHNLA